MMRGLLLGAVAVGAITFGAEARAQHFTGPYIGGNVGYGYGDVESIDLDGWNAPARNRWNYDIDGWSGGVQGGYDFAFGNFRLGIVGEASFGDIQGAGATALSEDTFTEVTIDSYALARVRGGFIVGDGKSLFYATLGGGEVHIDGLAYDREVSPGPGLFEGATDDNVEAWAYGIGFERLIGTHVSIGGEWIRLETEELTILDNGGLFDFDVQTEVDVLRFTANWAF